MSEFTANWNERIPKGNGLNVYEDGEKLGESEHEKALGGVDGSIKMSII